MNNFERCSRKETPELLTDVRKHFAVDDAGNVVWLQPTGPVRKGDIAGYFACYQYRQIGFKGSLYLAHRIAFALHFGRWPKGQVDHINGDRTNNSRENLRDVSHAENTLNKQQRSDNTSGATGVRWHSQAQKWNARIQRNGREKSLGVFADIKDAIAARKAAEKAWGFHENHGRAAK